MQKELWVYPCHAILKKLWVDFPTPNKWTEKTVHLTLSPLIMGKKISIHKTMTQLSNCVEKEWRNSKKLLGCCFTMYKPLSALWFQPLEHYHRHSPKLQKLQPSMRKSTKLCSHPPRCHIPLHKKCHGFAHSQRCFIPKWKQGSMQSRRIFLLRKLQHRRVLTRCTTFSTKQSNPHQQRDGFSYWSRSRHSLPQCTGWVRIQTMPWVF